MTFCPWALQETALALMATRPQGRPIGLRLTSPILYLWLAGPCLEVGELEWPSLPVAYLCLDPVEAPEPEDLASAQLHLCMVDLVQPLSILGDLLFGVSPSAAPALRSFPRYLPNP